VKGRGKSGAHRARRSQSQSAHHPTRGCL
jgi:hypothetical protein